MKTPAKASAVDRVLEVAVDIISGAVSLLGGLASALIMIGIALFLASFFLAVL